MTGATLWVAATSSTFVILAAAAEHSVLVHTCMYHNHLHTYTITSHSCSVLFALLLMHVLLCLLVLLIGP